MPVLTLPRADALSVRAKALVFEDPKSVALLQRIEQVARSHATVLIHGETGTGKEIVARHVHAQSPRRGRPFIAVNCGALSDSLVESELFGHERGAFTGAESARAGWFETAHGGTLFLDEIGDLSLSAQVKLLRVLQEGEVVRLGSRKVIQVDVRLIAATNVALEAAVAAGRFREDLYYRLNVASIVIPPLRDRPDDILPLAEHFIGQYCERLGIGRIVLEPEAKAALLRHDWPGNIRELENVIHHALLVCHDQRITAEDLRLTARLRERESAAEVRTEQPLFERALLELFEQNVPGLYQKLEERIMRTAYHYCHRNQLQTARLLGISRNVVRARLIQYGEINGTLRSSTAPAAPTTAPRAHETHAALHPVRSRRVVRIGYQRFGRLPLLKASGALERALDAQVLRVEWMEYLSGTQLVEAFESDELAFGAVGNGPSVLALAARVPIVYLAAEPLAPEGEAILVHADSAVRTVSDLRGRRVMVNRGANAHYLLLRALEEAQLGSSDVHIEYVPPDRAQAVFRAADADAWAIWDPFLGAARREAGARVLRDARGLSDNAVYYIGSRAIASERPEVIHAFLRELNAVSETGAAGATSGRVAPLDAEHIAGLQAVADTFLRHALIDVPVSVSEARWIRP